MAPFKKILCPIDFSEGSRQAMRFAIRLANESDAQLVLLHVWYVPAVTYAEMVYPAESLTTMSANAMHGVDDAVREAKSSGAQNVTGTFGNGVPWAEIVSALEDPSFDLCVIGTHGRTGLARVFLGSVAEKIVRRAPCSVIVVRPDNAPKPFKHVMCATDFSESAAFAVELARQLVSPDGTVELFHVIEVPAVISGELTMDELARDVDRRVTAALETEAARLARELPARVTTRARVGSAGAQTLAALDEDATVDLVVTGSHGRTGLRRVLLGSVAEKIVRHAKCPVLVARKR